MSKSYTCQNPSNTDYTAIITLSVIIIISSRTASYSWLETLLFPYNTKAGIPAYISLLRPSPGCPVTYWPSLLNYGDEFVQDLHLFPFSPEPASHRLS